MSLRPICGAPCRYILQQLPGFQPGLGRHQWPGRLDDRPLWELIYNHYIVQTGSVLSWRPGHGAADEARTWQRRIISAMETLTFTRSATSSPIRLRPPLPRPPGRSHGRRFTRDIEMGALSREHDPGIRGETRHYSGGPYTTLSTSTNNTTPSIRT